jgi:hypothetical protein
MEIMQKDEILAERLLDFSVRIIKICSKLTKNHVANHVRLQLVKSGQKNQNDLGPMINAQC